jgi:ParB family chromosome partitioning protein
MSNLTRTDEAARQRLASMTAVNQDTPTAAPATTRYTGTKGIRTALEVGLDRIERDEAQPRTEFNAEALDRLAESIKARGVLQPIRVRWDEGRGVYVLVVGERRWRAAKAAGLATIPCVVTEADLTPEERLEDQLVENALREDLRPVELARAYRTLMDRLGLSQHELAARLHVGQSTVNEVLSLLTLPVPIQAAVDEGRIARTVAYAASRVEDPAAQAELVEAAAAGKLTREEMRARTTRAPRSRPRPAEFRLEDGSVVIVKGPAASIGGRALVAALHKAWKLAQSNGGRSEDQGEAA